MHYLIKFKNISSVEQRTTHMGLPQFGLDQVTSAAYRYQSSAMGVDRLIIRCDILLRS